MTPSFQTKTHDTSSCKTRTYDTSSFRTRLTPLVFTQTRAYTSSEPLKTLVMKRIIGLCE